VGRRSLSRELWIVQAGIFLNMLGYGAVLPFEMIYLTDGRGFSTGTAGVVVGALSGVAVVSAPCAGPLIDRCGARTMTVLGGVALALGYGGLALATRPAPALAAAAVAGLGNGVLNPSQSALIAALTPSETRHRAVAISRVATNAGIGLGGSLGGLTAAHGLDGLVTAFSAMAATSLLYAGLIITLVAETHTAQRPSGGYRVVLRNRAFVRLTLINIAMIAVGWGVFSWLVPLFATHQLDVGTELIGLVLAANAVTVVVAQVPIARLAEGRRRVVMISVGGLLFAMACLIVIGADVAGHAALPALLGASVLVALGECFHTSALMPLVADLAPTSLRGRYMAAMALTWWIGLTLAPTLGGPLLSASPRGVLLAAAALAAAAAAAALALQGKLPERARLTPRPLPNKRTRSSTQARNRGAARTRG
jgi:MFS family permease